MEFIELLKQNAFKHLYTSDYTVDLQGWLNGGFQESLQAIS